MNLDHAISILLARGFSVLFVRNYVEVYRGGTVVATATVSERADGDPRVAAIFEALAQVVGGSCR